MSSHTPTYTLYLCILNQVFKKIQIRYISKLKFLMFVNSNVKGCGRGSALKLTDQGIISENKFAFQGLWTFIFNINP